MQRGVTGDTDGRERSGRDIDASFARGVAAYEAGQHYEAHEDWEEIWLDDDDDDRRLFVQALIQVTSAIHKVRKRVAMRGAPGLLDRAIDKLKRVRRVHWGIEPAELVVQVATLRAEVARLVAEDSSDLAEKWIPRLRCDAV